MDQCDVPESLRRTYGVSSEEWSHVRSQVLSSMTFMNRLQYAAMASTVLAMVFCQLFSPRCHNSDAILNPVEAFGETWGHRVGWISVFFLTGAVLSIVVVAWWTPHHLKRTCRRQRLQPMGQNNNSNDRHVICVRYVRLGGEQGKPFHDWIEFYHGMD